MKKSILLTLVLLMVLSALSVFVYAEEEVFEDEVVIEKIVPIDAPPIIIHFKEHINEWYSGQLFALDEAALYNSQEHVYRFTLLPSFYYSTVIRIEINQNGTATAHYKFGAGEGKQRDRGILQSKRITLSKKETREFLNMLDVNDYWRLPREVDYSGWDGYTVIIEGVKDGSYRVVKRWVPLEGGQAYAITQYFEAMIKQKFDGILGNRGAGEIMLFGLLKLNARRAVSHDYTRFLGID